MGAPREQESARWPHLVFQLSWGGSSSTGLVRVWGTRKRDR